VICYGWKAFPILCLYYTMVEKNRTPDIFSNLQQILVSKLINNFGTANLIQRVFSVQVSNWWALIKQGTSYFISIAAFFSRRRQSRKWVYAKRITFYFVLKPHEFKGFGANRLVKEFRTKLQKDHFEWFLQHLKEQLQQRLSAVWSGIQQTVVNEATDKWRQYLPACVHAKRRNFEHLL